MNDNVNFLQKTLLRCIIILYMTKKEKMLITNLCYTVDYMMHLDFRY